MSNLGAVGALAASGKMQGQYGGGYGMDYEEQTPPMDEFERQAAMTAAAPAPAADNSAKQAHSAMDKAIASATNVRKFGVPLTFKWSANSSAKPQRKRLGVKAAASKDTLVSNALASHKPLDNALKHQSLSTQEKFNVRALYLQKAFNSSAEPVALQVANLNGENLKKNMHQNGEWSTVTLAPGERADYSHVNDGLGVQLASNQLDSQGQINVNMSPADLMKYAETHPNHIDSEGNPTKHLVNLDLSGFGQQGASMEEKLAPLEKNPLGLLVYANAKAKINAVPGIEHAIGGSLPPADGDTHDLLPDLEVQPDVFGERGHFKALVSAAQLHDLVDHFSHENISKAQPTSAQSHVIALVHTSDSKANGRPVEGGAVHALFNYEIQHNGKPYGKEID